MSTSTRPPVVVAEAEPPAALAFVDTQPELPEERAARGWHDSSMELRRGLEVIENLPLEALPEHLRPRRR